MSNPQLSEALMKWRRAQRAGDTQAAARHMAEAERLRGRTVTTQAATTFNEAVEAYRKANGCDYRTAAHAVDRANPGLRAQQLLKGRRHYV